MISHNYNLVSYNYEKLLSVSHFSFTTYGNPRQASIYNTVCLSQSRMCTHGASVFQTVKTGLGGVSRLHCSSDCLSNGDVDCAILLGEKGEGG